MKRLFEV